MKKEKTSMRVQLLPDVHAKLKRAAKLTGCTQTEIVVACLRMLHADLKAGKMKVQIRFVPA